MNPTLLILAAGIGSRYGGVKQMDKVGPSGESIIDYSIYDAIRAGFGKVVFVINKKIEKDFKEIFNRKLKDKIETDYVLQEINNVPEGIKYSSERVKPWGTAHAVLVAKDKIHEPFVVVNADDFYGAGSYKLIKEFFNDIDPEMPQYCLAGYKLSSTLSEFGSVSRGICSVDIEDFLSAVVERTDIQKLNNSIGYEDSNGNWDILPDDTPVSMNIWGFTPSIFKFLEFYFKDFISKNAGNPKAEFFIPAVINDLIKTSKATVRMLRSKDQWFGVTYKDDKHKTIEKIRKLVEQGDYPKNLWE